MSNENYGLIILLVIFALGHEYLDAADQSPCLYKHNFLIDLKQANAKKRTCTELFDEANSRITGQQAELRDMAASLETAKRDIETLQERLERFGQRVPNISSPDVPTIGDPPTLSSKNDDDDD